jgi:basic membrane protein A and related proteins
MRRRPTSIIVPIVLAICVLGALLLSACGSSPTSKSTNASTNGKKHLKIALFLTGTLGDKGFFDAANAGVQRAKQELGADVKVVQGGDANPTAWRQTLNQLSDQGFDAIVFTPDNDFDGLSAVVKQHPKQRYISYDAAIQSPNTVSLTYKQNEVAYLAGVLAGQVATDKKAFPGATGAGKVGYITGVELPSTLDWRLGYVQGAKTINPAIKSDVAYVGNFSDQQKAYNLAKAMYGTGVDTIFAVAGGANQGVAKAAKDAGRYMMGVDNNMNGLYPGHTIATGLKGIPYSIYKAIADLADGKFEGGQTVKFGLESPGAELAMDQAVVPAGAIAKVQKARGDVIAGKIDVQSAFK